MSAQGVVLCIQLPVQIRQDEHRFVSCCPTLDVYSQGDTREKARENLEEALTLFLESCAARGTLERVLGDCGISIGKMVVPRSAPEPPPGFEYLSVPFQLLANKETDGACHA